MFTYELGLESFHTPSFVFLGLLDPFRRSPASQVGVRRVDAPVKRRSAIGIAAGAAKHGAKPSSRPPSDLHDFPASTSTVHHFTRR